MSRDESWEPKDDAARLKDAMERAGLTDKVMAELAYAYEDWTLKEFLRWMWPKTG